ncbi:MAG: hypothetical protein RIT45_3512 [Pseudomonadota bacterium]
MRRAVAATLSLLLVLSTAVTAFAEKRIVIEHVSYDDKTQELTLHADVLDTRGVPMDGVLPEDLEILASNVPLAVQSIELETSEKAGEPVAIVILMNGSSSYFIQNSDEVHSTFQQEKEGASQFIQRLGGNDKIAVLLYREGSPHEVVYSFASDFAQAKEAAANASVPDADLDPEGLQGENKRKRTLAPEVLRAVDKALGYFVDNLDKLGSARRRFLVVMSDGKDRETRKSKLTSKIDRILEKYGEYKIRVHAIGFTADDPQYLAMLQSLANGSGGIYKRIDSKDFATIPSVWDGIATRIKKQLIIRAKLEDLPDHGERVKGKDLANYVIGLKVKMKDGAEEEAQYNDVRLPLRGFDWMKLLKWVGIVLGGLLGVGLLIGLIMMIARRGKGGGGQVQMQQQVYDGPDRGKLFVRAGPLAGEILPLIDDVTTIGSMKGNTLVIEDGSVSRRHAAIKIDQMRYEIADLNSTNGVLVNGARIHKVFLKDGDKISIGTTELEFRLK